MIGSSTVRRVFCALTLLVSMSVSSSAESVTWRLFTDSAHANGPHYEAIKAPGEPFVIRAAECTNVPGEAADIVDGMDGASFTLPQQQISGDLVIEVILNVDDGAYDTVRGVALFLNISFEAFIDGQYQNSLSFSAQSPLEIMIPSGSGLNHLLGTCNLSRTDDLACVYDTGAQFTVEGIKTESTSSGIRVKLEELASFVGGASKDLGVPANVSISTWGAIKQMFR